MLNFHSNTDLIRSVVCATAMVNVWELLTHIPQEVRYIWLKIHEFSALKAIYIFARYYIFVSHYQVFTNGDVLEHLHPSQRSKLQMVNWLLYKSCLFLGFLWSVNFPLLKRVYVLYGGTRRIFYVVSVIGFAKLLLDIFIALKYHFELLAADFDIDTRPPGPTTSLIFLIAGELVVQGSILLLTFNGEWLSKAARSAVTARLLANGLSESLAVLPMVLCCLAVQVCVTPEQWIRCTYSMATMCFSVVGCRLILSTHRAFYQAKRTTFDRISIESSDEDEDSY